MNTNKQLPMMLLLLPIVFGFQLAYAQAIMPDLPKTNEVPFAVCEVIKPLLVEELKEWRPRVDAINATAILTRDMCRFQVVFPNDSTLISYVQASIQRDFNAVKRIYDYRGTSYYLDIVLLAATEDAICSQGGISYAQPSARCDAEYRQTIREDILNISQESSAEDPELAAFVRTHMTSFWHESLQGTCAVVMTFESPTEWLKSFLLPRLAQGRPLTWARIRDQNACLPFYPYIFSSYKPISRASISN